MSGPLPRLPALADNSKEIWLPLGPCPLLLPAPSALWWEQGLWEAWVSLSQGGEATAHSHTALGATPS